ncbi:MAG TPA: carboxymuconolactone decarboxylase family protein [Bacteriovoracaceae bacterium]|nr:carboxymuconolactone decarboxylase family protein [Bacteriovoracaceae bacterium]
MSIETLKDLVKDYGKDIRINLDSLLSGEGTAGLTQIQLHGIFLASAYATRSESLKALAEELTQETLSETEREGVKAAVTIMGMNNIYYRYLHLLEGQEELRKLPAKLRMNVIGKPGIDKANFELYSLAVSSISGCGACINAHVHELQKSGVGDSGIQSSIRIAAVVNATAQALFIG